MSLSTAKDIIVFTLHKSASMFIHRQCQLLCQLCHIPLHSPNSESGALTARALLTDPDLWRSRHGCFAPIRFFVDVPHLDDYEVILHLRDPRDVLVSMFYSYCFIHSGELAGNSGYRRDVATRGIDEFVLAKASERSAGYRGDYGTGGHVEDLIGNVPMRYRHYLDRLLGRDNVRLLKYEQMVTDYRSWLGQFIQPFPIENRAALIEELARLAPTFFPSRSHDVMTHVRHVAPGDHKLKLQPATIDRLNTIFADTLDALGYERGGAA